ncbi:hypothetical protein D9M71_712800 [compost metagenome]
MGRCRDFEHSQVQTFENLQQAVKGRGFHGHGVAGVGHRTQGQVDRFGRAVGDHHFLGAQVGLCRQRSSGKDVAQLDVAAGRACRTQQFLILTQCLAHMVLQNLQRIEFRRAVGTGDIDLDRRALAGLEHR